MTLEQIESAMRPQFIWDKEGLKPLQTCEVMEGSKDVARMIFCGIADMFGMDRKDVQLHLDMSHEMHRGAVTRFREHLRESKIATGTAKRFGVKVGLCINAINYKHNVRPFVDL